MPGMDGFEVAKKLKAQKKTKDIPIIMVTALEDRSSRVKGLTMGAEEFISKPIDREEMQMRVRNLLRLKHTNNLLKEHNRALDQRVQHQAKKIKRAFSDGLTTLMRTAEFCDDSSGAHIHRISKYTKLLAEGMGLSKEFCDMIARASCMHDIGNIGVPDTILTKTSILTAEEWKVIQGHTTMGAKILENVTSPYLKLGAEIALYHHENWDGSGYPYKIKGKAIPMSARIMRICDVYDALRSKRPYKQEMDHEMAVSVIRHGDHRTRPDHFMPEMREAFFSLSSYFKDIFSSSESTNLA